ncbi:siderophore-interacting protein [Nesterenkonia lacusekhoensis]|uniref:NADPH-dependent ferric siderophore reductase n=1 Tax=Nesterenkonia lacusekhoensis TaxID=150832 RepID=A0ABS4T2B5_9MICC|nr:siderophore-interacting protein [Nesterenkonia lacusekhoensis]MBP2318589.1 NADPH-dependent ferric siderophore reductase [Nesterenkonia lacusekhoensis]
MTQRRPRTQHLLTVIRREQIRPHMVRLILGGDGFEGIEFRDHQAESSGERTPCTDQYIKLLFADPALGLQRPYDMEALREELPVEQMPVTRTYTIRHVDRQLRQIWVDFVTHGDQGLAGPWAENAQPGDTISFFGPGAGYTPRSDADFHLLAGDEAALPAIAAALENMEPQARGLAVLEVHDAAEELPLNPPAGVEVVWLHRGGDFTPEATQLADYLRTAELPDAEENDIQVFIHGEREQMKLIRRALVEERGLPRKGMSLSAYWAYGRAEDEFQAEKKTPVGQIDPA